MILISSRPLGELLGAMLGEQLIKAFFVLKEEQDEEAADNGKHDPGEASPLSFDQPAAEHQITDHAAGVNDDRYNNVKIFCNDRDARRNQQIRGEDRCCEYGY